MLSGRAVKSFGGYPRGLVFASMLSFSAHAELDLSPLQDADWSRSNAAHLASRAGFGATQEELDSLALLSAQDAVEQFIVGKGQPLAVEFDASDIFDVGLDPFPPSRPATTTLARRQGHALGVSVKPAGNRPLQPVVNKFFYWLRASRLETDRVAYWWANRMLSTPHPLQEKIALFWHGHFATNEDKVRDYRKMLQQLALFHDLGLGRFRELMVAVATDPAMLVFLDAGVNVKDSPNENFAREIMELFTMGVGHYGEKDVQEAARAFTGWNYRGLDFHLVEQEHDRQMKTFLGRRGNFDGVEIIDLIMDQPSTAQYIGAKLYRYFVNQDLRAEDEAQLGRLLSGLEFDIAAFLRTLFLSNDFYDSGNRGSHIKSPVELMVSTYRFLGLSEVPGVPDFNVVSGALGQRLMHPPTVAGWSQGRSWITPSLMFERNNFILEVLYPDIGFVPRGSEGVRDGPKHLYRTENGPSQGPSAIPTGFRANRPIDPTRTAPPSEHVPDDQLDLQVLRVPDRTRSVSGSRGRGRRTRRTPSPFDRPRCRPHQARGDRASGSMPGSASCRARERSGQPGNRRTDGTSARGDRGRSRNRVP